jgi:PAS domain-containing protein
MKSKKNSINAKINNNHGVDFAERIWNESWTYIKTVVDTIHEPFLILDKNLTVVAANESFYNVFQVTEKETENKLIYELGNRQWDIPQLQKLLEDILLQNTFFKGFEVTHDFPVIGKKIMILNARRVYSDPKTGYSFPPIILLAMEDITEMMGVAEMLTKHTNHFEKEMEERTGVLENHIRELEIKIATHNIKL